MSNRMGDPVVGARDAVVIERLFDVPAGVIWQMWTDPEHFAAWYGPAGASVLVTTMDVRVGGTRHLAMEVDSPSGPQRMWFVGQYREVLEPRRLTYTESMSDENGRALAPAETGLPADHPATTEVIVELEDLDGRTRMVLTHAGIPAGSPGAAGWMTALDKLAALVEAPG
jgi:uncharacterized protein YndB with AHSA1/START domain